MTWFIITGDKAGTWVDYVIIPLAVPFVASLLLTNSQHNFLILKSNTTSNNPFDLSVFFKTKLDYYDSQINNWFRYKPGIGFELNKEILKAKMGFSLSLGYEKPFDYKSHRIFNNGISPFGSVMVSLNFD